jgi:hypothetical protein
MKKRKIYGELLREKDNHKVSIILGARQVGKTTVLKALHQELGGLFLDLDVLENFERVSSFSRLLETIRSEGYAEGKPFYLFLDEFQSYEDLSRIMKNVYDNLPDVKIYASGSSSLTIQDRVQESLAGRKRLHYLHPLDFEEFLWFKGDEKALRHFSNAHKLAGNDLHLPELHKLLEEYLVYGGYPEVVLTPRESKKEVLTAIFDLYVKKELVEYLKVEKVLGAKRLMEYLAINNAQKIKYAIAAENCSLKQREVMQFLEVLKETFIISGVRPFFTNKNKELTKISKVYFMDNGVRNYFINNFNALRKREDSGFLFEAFVLQELIKGGIGNIRYWQDKEKREVDFVINKVSSQIPVEVKYKKRLKKSDLAGIRTFYKDYKPSEGYLVNLSRQESKAWLNYVLPFDLYNSLHLKALTD